MQLVNSGCLNMFNYITKSRLFLFGIIGIIGFIFVSIRKFADWVQELKVKPMHFLHKTFPGPINKISHWAKFHSSRCLVSWSCSLANWESTFFSQNLALLNISSTVHKLYTWLAHPKQLCGMPDMSLVSLTGSWCPWQRGNNQKGTLNQLFGYVEICFW